MEEQQPELALWEAVEAGTLADLRKAISEAADLDAPGWYRGRHGFTPLSKAAFLGKLNFVKELIAAGASPKKGSVNNCLTAAAQAGHIDIIKYLINCIGINVDSGNEYGHTALANAAYSNQEEVLKYLLRFGADPNACASDTTRAIDGAAMSPECFAVLYPLTKPKARKRALRRFWSQQQNIAKDKGIALPSFPGIPPLSDEAVAG